MPKRLDHATRRTNLVGAVWRLVLRDGVAAASVRGVAREAGLATGSVRHLFPTQDELLRFAMRAVIEKAGARIGAGVGVRAALVKQGRPLDAALALLEQVLPLDDERLVEARVWAAFGGQTITDPAIAAIRREADEGMRHLCESCLHDLAELDELGAGRDIALEAERLRSLLDGMTMHILLEPPGARPWAHVAHRILSTHLADLALGIGTVNAADSDATPPPDEDR